MEAFCNRSTELARIAETALWSFVSTTDAMLLTP